MLDERYLPRSCFVKWYPPGLGKARDPTFDLMEMNHDMLGKLATLMKILVITNGVRAQRYERTAHPGSPPIRATCGLRAAQG